jgi:hypothetical protein
MPALKNRKILTGLQPLSPSRVGRTLLSVTFEVALDVDGITTAASSTVRERCFFWAA